MPKGQDVLSWPSVLSPALAPRACVGANKAPSLPGNLCRFVNRVNLRPSAHSNFGKRCQPCSEPARNPTTGCSPKGKIMTAPLITTSKIVFGSAIVCALLAGCNKREDTAATTPPATTVTPATPPADTAPAPATPPSDTTTPPPAGTPPPDGTTTPPGGTTPPPPSGS